MDRSTLWNACSRIERSYVGAVGGPSLLRYSMLGGKLWERYTVPESVKWTLAALLTVPVVREVHDRTGALVWGVVCGHFEDGVTSWT